MAACDREHRRRLGSPAWRQAAVTKYKRYRSYGHGVLGSFMLGVDPLLYWGAVVVVGGLIGWFWP